MSEPCSLDSLPGYAEALKEERSARDFAFIPVSRTICGVRVRAMTVRDLAVRLNISCPFLFGGTKMPGHVASFLWQLREPEKRKLRARFWETERKRFIERIAKEVRYADALEQIDEYLDFTFLDAPSTQSKTQSVPKTSLVAAIIHFIAINYHWSEEEILNCPLVRLYQYFRLILSAKNPNAILFNRRSDKIRGDYLRAIAATANSARTLN
jgi:hypothetical protein